MRVLLDEQLPRQLAREIAGHDVSSVQREGWAGLGNGNLLRAACDRGFDAFVLGRTRVVCNPRGYDREPVPDFEPGFTLDLPPARETSA